MVSFIRTHIDHLLKLRFLLTLHSAPSGTTTLGLVARAIDAPKGQVRDMANELVEGGLVRVSSDKIELAPGSLEDRLALTELAACYFRNSSAVIEALRALGRVETA